MMKRQLTHDDIEIIKFALASYHTVIPMQNPWRKTVESLFDVFKDINDSGDVCEIQTSHI